jgi:DNA (cytosine-5)-methyltransferase 1
VTEITFGSLFAGIGGIDLGFERAGMACKWQVEIDPYAQRVLAKHWPDVRRHDDVRTWPQPNTERVDVIAGGFPCQDISYAGKGAGLAGERSGLFYEVARIVREMGPRVVVLENVAALLTRGLGDVLGTLASLGYDAEWHCIPAAAVGAPHIRDRVFLIASNEANAFRSDSNCVGSHRKKMHIIRGSKLRDEQKRIAGQMGQNVADAASFGSGEREKYSRRIGVDINDPSNGANQWEAEPAVGRVADGVPARVDRLRGLGNAVVPQVAEFVGRMVVEALNREPAEVGTQPPGENLLTSGTISLG